MLTKREIPKGTSAKLSIMGSIALENKYSPGQEIELFPAKDFIDGANGIKGEFKDVYINNNYIGTLHYLCWKETN